MTDCYIFDIDGTIADLTHRLHHISEEFDDQGMRRKKNWDAFFAEAHKDAPIPHIITLARHLAMAGTGIVYVSGRSDQCRRDTSDWLGRHELPVGTLYMREAGDHRPDNIVKAELLEQLQKDGYKPLMVFDDRSQVVKMWRERGIPCAQVAEGDF